MDNDCISGHVSSNRLRVTVKPNAKKTEVIGYEGDTVKIAVAAPADKDKANKELLRFITRQTKRKALIKSGKSSREKIIEFL